MNTASQNLVQVGVSMVLRDNFTKEAGRISQSFRSMMADMENLTRGYRASFGDISEIGMNLVGSMYDAYKYSAQVQNEVWLTSKIAGANLKEAKELWNTAQEVNAETPLTAMQVASAERYLAMAGNSAKDIKNLVRPAAKLASIFGLDPGGKGGVADIMTNIMSMFQMDTSQANSVADDIFTAVTSANMSLEDLMATIRYSGADMNAAGVSFRELAAAAGALGDVGIQGTMAGTSLGNMIRYLNLTLAGQKKNGIDTLNELGLSVSDFYDSMGNFKGLGNALQKFESVYKNMTSLERTQDFYNMLGVRGMRGMIPILEAMSKGKDKFTIIMSRYDQNQGKVDETMEEFSKTNQGVLDKFNSSVENLITTIGQASEGPFRGLLSIGTSLVDSLNEFAQSDKGAKTIGYVVGMTITGTVWLTLKGILATIQNIALYTNTVTTGVTATATNTAVTNTVLRTRLLSIEQNLHSMITNQHVMIKLLARLNGMDINPAGQWYISDEDRYGKNKKGKKGKRGQYVKSPGIPAGATILDDGVGSGGSGGGGGSSTTKGPGTKWWGKGIGGVAGGLLKAVNVLGYILMGVQTVSFISDLINSNTQRSAEALEEEKNRERQRRKANEDLWYEAVKQGVIEGMRESNLKVTVDPSMTDAALIGGPIGPGYSNNNLLGF